MTAETGELSLSEIRLAADRIRPYILATPLLNGEALAGPGVWLKAENLQRTGSFKLRGAVNAVAQLTPEQRGRGVITLSAGNHGQALAYAARTFGVPCVVVVRDDAQRTKLDAIRSYGAELVLVPIDQWQTRLEEEQARRHLQLVHPFDDPLVVAGQATVGQEILEAVSDLRSVVVPVGGGGLISGVAMAIKQQRPEVRIFGVEPQQAAVVSESLAAGHPVAPSRLDSIADALATPYTRLYNLDIIRRYVDRVLTVSDEAIAAAVKLVAIGSKLLVEPAGAAAVAALLDGDGFERPAVVILSGGNVDASRLARWLV
jgi:threonine dehydratase